MRSATLPCDGGAIWLFIDEFGNMKFGQNGSKYFGLASIATEAPDGLTAQMDALRHSWWLDGHIDRGFFHAREDCWPVRQAVFERFTRLPIVRSDVIALAKRAVLKDRQPPGLLYRTAARELLRFVMPQLAHYDRAFVVAADLRPLIDDVAWIVREVLTVELWEGRRVWSRPLRVVQASAGVHSGLQLADYVAWASNRRRMFNDATWMMLVEESGAAWSDHVAFGEE